MIPDAVTNLQQAHKQSILNEELHNAILRTSQQKRNGASSAHSSKGQEYFFHEKGKKGYKDVQNTSSSRLTLENRKSMAEDDSGKSMQFSYYGRRFAAAAQNEMPSPMPNAEIVNGVGNPKLIGIPLNPQNSQPQPRRRAHKVDCDEEPQPSFIMADNETTLNRKMKKEYDLEERMNHNLMKQFKGMCSDENNSQNNSVSEFTKNLNQFQS